MKLKFKVQPYQTNAVQAVVECFAGQLNMAASTYRIDPGRAVKGQTIGTTLPTEMGFRNPELQLSDAAVLENIRQVQRRQNLPMSDKLVSNASCNINLDIEMETGTGKTYCYIKTIFEMFQRYGWSKFIIVVPSIAIREGVYKSFNITADHFVETYRKKARFFLYNSKQLHHLESFSSDAGINVMIINIQAFNARGSDNRRIYDELDDFQSRRPIDVISANRPILILDEPQKMEGKATLESLAKFKPMMILRYSATHRTNHNKIYRLDALDAYNQKLVKKIAVNGITVKGLAGTTAYFYLSSIEVSTKAPLAVMEIEVRQNNGIKRVVKRLGKGKDLCVESNELDQYRGFVISQIDATQDTVEFTNGQILTVGDATGEVTESMIRRIQIREAIGAHLQKEQQLYQKGIKILSLFFIDEVAKYRDYSQSDEKGEYARIFEEEYENLTTDYLKGELAFDNKEYRQYLSNILVARTHNGYFSIDKKSKRLTDPSFSTRGEDAGLSDDVDAYDLILRDKERLLSFEEPVRFIFSHSALREGWDNPNVFVMCMLKHSDNTISRRQEVGRGLRLSVNQFGDRMDHPSTVHSINVLTVVASESYKEFVSNLQKEINAGLSERPRIADKAYFVGKILQTENDAITISEDMANDIEFFLIQNGYVDKKRNITEKYHNDLKTGSVAELPVDLKPYTTQIIELVNGVFSESQLVKPDNARNQKRNPLNDNFEKREFKELWERINRKAVYRVDFDSTELVRHSIRVLDAHLHVSPLQYTVQRGEQTDNTTYEELKAGQGFKINETETDTYHNSIRSMVKYDLLGKVAENTQLTRKTVAAILNGINQTTFYKFKQNPEHFITEASRHINEQKAAVIIERLSYDEISEKHDIDIFTAGQSNQDFSRATEKLKSHIYDYVMVDSKNERDFVTELDGSTEVVVYAKLPRGFFIPTPVGDYSPDWAITFKEGAVKHIYFVAETKGSMSSLELREIENKKIECARKYFDEINRRIDPKHVKYDVINSFGRLMELVC